ncbi:MAG: hypothetical protein C5B52_02150 [Bacteroidetes bacterium]|nr:MAG: hypothetical protein C5B52_02150 [Bacteroidota bacterium]
MKKIIPALIFMSGIFANMSCGHNSKGDNNNKNDSAFYPISPYIIQQTKVLDSALLAIVHYRTENGKTDTSILDKPAFHEIAKEFTTPDINDPAVKPKFTEDAFADATIGTITFTYTSNDPDFPLWKASVLLNKDDMRVIYVYMEKQMINSDSTVLKKMIWKTDSNCQISSIIRKKGQPDKDIVDKFVWDESKH